MKAEDNFRIWTAGDDDEDYDDYEEDDDELDSDDGDY